MVIGRIREGARLDVPDARATLESGVGHVPMPIEAIERTLASAIEDQIAKTPDAVAVRLDDLRLTYAQLGDAADRVAADLVTAGIGEHSRSDGFPPIVAVVATQSIELIVAIVGVLKVGGAYVPIDPATPARRATDLLDLVGAAALVADEPSNGVAGRAAGGRPVVVATREGRTASRSPRIDDPMAVAYLYATSGSTGKSKIVVDRHRNVIHNIRRYSNSLQIGPGDRMSLVQSSTFSGAVSSLFGALLNGASCHIFDVRRDGVAALGPWVGEMRLTMYHSVPVLFRALCTDGAFYPDVRVVRLEGDAAAWSDVALFQRHFGSGSVLVNGLGTTETGVVRQFFADHVTTVGHGSLPLGYEVPDMEVGLVDETGAPVAPGREGEIEVRSEYLALGYFGDEQRTRDSFRPDDGHRRRYRTGDLGRVEPGGLLRGLGRRDFTEKIRGEMVDPSEVEAHLRAQPGIREAVAMTRRDGRDSARLVAYVVPDDGARIRREALRRSLASELPAASVPSSFITLRELPLDASAKVDRARLPAPPTSRPELDTPYEPPRSQMEEELAALWEDLLGIQGVGIDDDFFALGGDSLDAAKLTVAIGERWGTAAADDAVASASTIAELARRIESTGDTTTPVLFAVPGDRSNPGFFARPARALDGRLLLRSLPPTGDPADIAADATLLEAMIRAAQPHGPYHLAGFCFGAVTALEVAHRLSAGGQDVATVVLLGISPVEFPTLIDRRALQGIAGRAEHWVRAGLAGLYAAGDARERRRFLVRNLGHMGRAIRRSARRRLSRRGLLRPAAHDDLERRVDAIATLRARPFDGRVVVILGARSARAYTRRPDVAWAGLGRDVEVVVLPGRDHDMLLDPVAGELATVLATSTGADAPTPSAAAAQQS